jgi:hypothetical protein
VLLAAFVDDAGATAEISAVGTRGTQPPGGGRVAPWGSTAAVAAAPATAAAAAIPAQHELGVGALSLSLSHQKLESSQLEGQGPFLNGPGQGPDHGGDAWRAAATSLLRGMVAPPVRPGWGVMPEQRGWLAVATLDSFGDKVCLGGGATVGGGLAGC